MTNPDRTMLDRIDQAWDERVQSGSTRTNLKTDGLGEAIDALYRADRPIRPSAEFRHRLRRRLLAQRSSVRTNIETIDSTFDAGETGTVPPARGDRRADNVRTNRRWWASHIGELAAMLLVIAAVVVAVALFTDGDDSFEPAGTGVDQELEPDESGIYHDVTFAQAQVITPFDLIDPQHVPDGYRLAEIAVEGPPPRDWQNGDESQPISELYTVMFLFHSVDMENRAFELRQSNSSFPPPSLSDGTGPGSNGNGDNSQLDVPASVQQFIEIDGLAVVRTTHHNPDSGDEITVFTWHQDRVGMRIHGVTGIHPDNEHRESEEAVSVEDLEDLVRRLVHARRSDDGPRGAPQAVDETGTNESGLHRYITFDEAQAATSFETLMPEFVPDGYGLAGVLLSEDGSTDDLPDGSLTPVDGEQPLLVLLVFVEQDGLRPALHLVQTNAQIPYHDLTDFVTPFGRGDFSESEHPVGELDLQVRRVDDLGVYRTTLGTGDGNQMLHYQWYQDHLTAWLQVIGEPDDPDNAQALGGEIDSELERMIESITSQRSTDWAPPFGDPSPEL